MSFLDPNIKGSFRKKRRGKNKCESSNANTLAEGNFGLMAVTKGEITSKQYESARKAFVQIMRQRIKLINRFHLNVSRTAKPLESRMGKGKGDIDRWAFIVRPGRILFEVKIFNKDYQEIVNALMSASYKLPFKTKVISRQ